MKPDLSPPSCPECGEPAALAPRKAHYRRAERVLAVDTWTWECASCADPFTGERPFRFADAPLMRWSDDRGRALWVERFGEAMPPSERGRRPGPNRTVRVPVMLTPQEAVRLDEVRGDLSRSEFLRRAIGGR